MNASNFGTPVRKTATATVWAVPGRLLGFYVASTSSGTLVFRDGGASGTQVTGTITPEAGPHGLSFAFSKDLHVTVGGTIDVTFVCS
jgi:hypothetical protein